MSTPQTTLYICSGVHLDPRYNHSIYFENEQAQQEYFAGKVVKTFPALSYLRKTWPVQVSGTMEQARTWSYLYFHNGTGKTYYYFITQVEYKNDAMVELTLELDVLQTYFFDFQLMPCFIERQHTTTDVPGDNTVDEGLELGELVDNKVNHWEGLKNLCILVLSTFNPNYTNTEQPVDALGYRYDNVFSGLTVWAVDMERWADWSVKLNTLSNVGFIDGIVSMWVYPKDAVRLGGENTWSDDVLCKVVAGTNSGFNFFVERPDNLNGYYPKNKKLLTYPYNILYATNNLGGSAVYRYERFTNANIPTFGLVGTISPDGAVKMYPKNYNGINSYSADGIEGDTHPNYEQGLTLGNFPTCAWDADVYKMWLAQNQNQLNHSMDTAKLAVAGGAVSAIGSLFMGNVVGALGGAGAMIGGAQQIGSLLAQKADMAIQPPQSRGNFSSNVNTGAGYQTFSFYNKTVDKEHAKIIDDYFTMYGYKLNRVEKPNICARPSFTYVKTVGCNIAGVDATTNPKGTRMCTEDRLKICSIFDQGITFWKKGDRIADYTQENRV